MKKNNKMLTELSMLPFFYQITFVAYIVNYSILHNPINQIESNISPYPRTFSLANFARIKTIHQSNNCLYQH